MKATVIRSRVEKVVVEFTAQEFVDLQILAEKGRLLASVMNDANSKWTIDLYGLLSRITEVKL